MPAGAMTFHLLETTVAGILRAYEAGELSTCELVQLYINRIEAFDSHGPAINSIITLNPRALEDADRLDATRRTSGPVGPLHGVPVILKDQIDAQGMPTTLGSVLFKDYFPDRDAFVVERLKQAGAIILAKATLGEMGMGDTHGSLFGSTRNPYDPERTVGGSSGGPAAAVSANLGAVAVGQEALASIRRPAAWNALVGMRPTAGLVSRSGVYAGWPATAASLGPLTRTVEDAAVLLDALVGYDAEDPLTALGVGQGPSNANGVTMARPSRASGRAESYTGFLDPAGLKGARIGVLRESMGSGSEPESEDFRKVDRVFDSAVSELKQAGTTVVDPVVIPRLKELLGRRAGVGGDEAFHVYFGRSKKVPFGSQDEMQRRVSETLLVRRPALGGTPASYAEYLVAREELMIGFLKAIADHQLDAIVHKSVEHQPTLISQGVNPPYVNIKGATHLNTFLVYVPAISVPAGFTSDGLPVGITFTGRAYSEGTMIRLAYAYEQATQHRKPPETTPALAGEP